MAHGLGDYLRPDLGKFHAFWRNGHAVGQLRLHHPIDRAECRHGHAIGYLHAHRLGQLQYRYRHSQRHGQQSHVPSVNMAHGLGDYLRPDLGKFQPDQWVGHAVGQLRLHYPIEQA